MIPILRFLQTEFCFVGSKTGSIRMAPQKVSIDYSIAPHRLPQTKATPKVIQHPLRLVKCTGALKAPLFFSEIRESFLGVGTPLVGSKNTTTLKTR